MTLADRLVASLAAHDLRVTFGPPGAHTVPLYRALARARRVRYLRVRHEQGATFMADGYARPTGRVGVALTTTGPGLTNAATGVVSAWLETGFLVVPRRACSPWAPPTPSLPPSTTG